MTRMDSFQNQADNDAIPRTFQEPYSAPGPLKAGAGSLEYTLPLLSTFLNVDNPAEPASDPALLAFHGAGRRRLPWEVHRERERRERDAHTAARLERAGIDGRVRGHTTLTPIDLATTGAMAGDERLELRRWRVFQEHTSRERRASAARIRSFLDAEDPERRTERRILQVVLRARDGGSLVATRELARGHVALTGVLGEMLGYAARRMGDAVIPISYGVHHRPVDGGAAMDIHVHVALYAERRACEEATKADRENGPLGWFTRYMARRFEVFASPTPCDADDAGGAEAEAGYELDDLRPEDFAVSAPSKDGSVEGGNGSAVDWLAEYVRQRYIEHRLHCHAVLGPLRQHVGKLKRERQRPVLLPTGGPDGADELQHVPVPVRERPARRADAPRGPVAGPEVAAIRLAWVGEELRPVALVRGWQPGPDAWCRLTARYDLDTAVAAARIALERASGTPLQNAAVNPESSLAGFRSPYLDAVRHDHSAADLPGPPPGRDFGRSEAATPSDRAPAGTCTAAPQVGGHGPCCGHAAPTPGAADVSLVPPEPSTPRLSPGGRAGIGPHGPGPGAAVPEGEAAGWETTACEAYRLQTERMLKPGADPETVFPSPSEFSAALREAHAAAVAAQATARRRAEGRRKRAATVARATERDAWHAEHAGDDGAWRARLAEIGDRKAAAVERVLRAGSGPEIVMHVEMAFASTFAAEHRACWRAQGKAVPARSRALPRDRGSPPNCPDEIDLMIPW